MDTKVLLIIHSLQGNALSTEVLTFETVQEKHQFENRLRDKLQIGNLKYVLVDIS